MTFITLSPITLLDRALELVQSSNRSNMKVSFSMVIINTPFLVLRHKNNDLTIVWPMTQEIPGYLGLFVCICDTICKNLPYGGTNIVGPGQTPSVMHGV